MENKIVNMYEIVPVNLLTEEYTIIYSGTPIATIALKIVSLKDAGVITIDKKKYIVHRDGVVSGQWVMEDSDKHSIGVAEKPKFYSDTINILYDDSEYSITSKMFSIKDTFNIYKNNEQIGTVTGVSLFSRKLILTVTIALPVEIIVFCVYCALILINRKRS